MTLTVLSLTGALLALLAYYMVSNEKWTPSSTSYHAVNLVSALILGSVAIYTGTAGFILLNAVWGGVAMKALIERLFQRSGVGTASTL